MNPKYIGSDFDDFLREEGLLDEATAVALERVSDVKQSSSGNLMLESLELFTDDVISERDQPPVQERDDD